MRSLLKRSLFTSFKLILIVFIAFSMTSCWSAHNIEEQAYITAMGIDYKDDLYYIYGHEMSFSEIDEPKMREGNVSKGIFVGTGTGKTMAEAAYSLERAIQGQIDWGHVEAIVVSEEAMKKDNISLIRKMNRHPTTRTNTWFYVTKDPIVDILSTSNIYDDASMRTILYEPYIHYRRHSHIKPVISFKLIANFLEPDRTVIIPVITLNKEQWQAAGTNIDLLEISGAYVASRYGNNVMLDKDEAHLLRVIFESSNFSLPLEKDDETLGVVHLGLKKKENRANITGTDVTFDINLAYGGAMVELSENVSYKELINLAKEGIEAQIREAYAIGIEKQIDVLNLMPSLRRKNPVAWRQLTNGGKEFILTEDSLQNINIKIHIPFNGKYKRSVPDEISKN